MNIKLKYKRWRERAYKVLEQHGEMTMHILIDHIPYMRLAPKNVNSATQLLLKDKRFVSRKCVIEEDGDMLPKTTDRSRYKVMVWRLADEN